MNFFLKIIFSTFLCLCLLTYAFSQSLSPHIIELRLNPEGDALIDPGETPVYKGDSVYWRIIADPRIKSFNIIGAGHPFTQAPPNANNDYSLIKRKVGRRGKYDWKYKIAYRLKSNPLDRKYLDPKIAVQPTPHPLLLLVLGSGLILTFITSLIFFTKWRITERNLQTLLNNRARDTR